MASGGHPCPSLSGQPQAPTLPLGPRELKGGCWGLGDFSFLSGFLPIAVREAAAERTLFYTPASLNERACGKSLCPEMGVYVSLGLGMVQSRRSWGCGCRAVRSPCNRRDRARFCCRQTSSLCCRSGPLASHEKSTEASPSKATSRTFSLSGCHAMTFVLQLKIQLQRAFSNVQK